MPTDRELPTPDGEPAEVPEFTIAHLSDTHLTPIGIRYNGRIDADAALASVAEQLRIAAGNGYRFDAVVASGDLTDTGDPDAYRRLRAALEPLGVPLIFATGNHDVRTVFHRELLGIDAAHPLVQQVWLDDRLRVVVLDSTIVGAGHGRLTAETLAELDGILGTAAPAGTIVVLHHAPIPPPSPALVYFALERASRRALAEVVGGRDVRLILAGHHHIAQSGVLSGVPVAVAGSTAIRTDPLAPHFHEHTTESRAFNLVRIYPDTVTTTVVPVDGAAEVFNLVPEQLTALITAHPTT